MLPEQPKKKDDATEKDLGFGPSHGYDAEHGGPTGPGDAPAKPAPKAPAKASAMADAFRLECRDTQRVVRKSAGFFYELGVCNVD
jgi:hypothetical protein